MQLTSNSSTPLMCTDITMRRLNARGQELSIDMLNLKNQYPYASNECLAFKGCSWRPVPAHPWCAHWHHYEEVKLAVSELSNDMLNLMNWYLRPFVSMCFWWMFCLQGMQLTTNSSTPSMCKLLSQYNSWTREVKSFQMICWTLYIRFCFR